MPFSYPEAPLLHPRASSQPPDWLIQPAESPLSSQAFATHNNVGGHEQPAELVRKLENNDDSWQSVLVDEHGNEYDSYALSWRYLGVYIDCYDFLNDYSDDNVEDGGEHRNLGSGSGDENDCTRKVLWAAYVDPRYKGGQIGEYQYFDPFTNKWDKSSCTTRRCAKMNCHERRTHFKLVGVYKETDGFTDWAEQLFKHHGYCQWDEDTYESMENLREDFPSECTSLYYSDWDGKSIYSGTKPLPEGNVTIGLYYDEQCTQDSGLTWADYIQIYNSNYYYGDSDGGVSRAAKWTAKMDAWNEALSVYKICQPCRAYNLGKYSDDSGSGSGDSGDRRRKLGDDNDGEGDAEINGYDCYDDAGYTNCNQCYKFETQTDMEAVEIADLELASKQGSILRIKVGFHTYGKGGFSTFQKMPNWLMIRFGVAWTIIVALYLLNRLCGRRKRKGNAALKEAFDLEKEVEDFAEVYTGSCAIGTLDIQVRVVDTEPYRPCAAPIAPQAARDSKQVLHQPPDLKKSGSGQEDQADDDPAPQAIAIVQEEAENESATAVPLVEESTGSEPSMVIT